MSKTHEQEIKEKEALVNAAAKELAGLKNVSKAVQDLGPHLIEMLKMMEKYAREKKLTPENVVIIMSAVAQNCRRALINAAGAHAEVDPSAPPVLTEHDFAASLMQIGFHMERQLIEQSKVVGVGKMVLKL